MVKIVAKKKRKGIDISGFVQIRSVRDGIITYDNNISAVLMKVGSLNLALLDEEEQKIKINQFSNVLSLIQGDCSIVKLERPMELTGYIENQQENLKIQHRKFKNGEMSEKGYNERLKQVNYEKNLLTQYSESTPVLTNEFYLIIYGRSVEELVYAYNNTFEKLLHIKLEPKRCDDDEIKYFLYNVYNPLGNKTLSDFRNNSNFREDILPEFLEFHATKIKSDSMVASIQGIYDFPMNVGPTWLAPIVNIPNTTCVINIKHVPTSHARTLMDRAITEIKTQMLNRNKSSEDIAKQTQLESFLYILEEIERGSEILKQVNVLLMGYGVDQYDLKKINRTITSSIKQAAMKADKLICRQMEGFVGILPTPRDDIMNDNGRDMPSLTLAAGFPFVFQSLEDKDGILLGYNRTNLIFFDPTVRNPNRTNSNIMVIGKSGSGKSHFTKKLLLKMLLQDIKVCIVDPEGEYDVLTDRLGGQSIDVGAAVDSRINPFHIFGQMQEDVEEGVSEEKKKQTFKAIFSSHIQFLEQFFQSVIPDLTNKELSRLSEMMIESYRRKGIKEDEDFEDIANDKFPVIDDLLAIVEEKISKLSDIIVKEPNRSVDLGDELSDLRNLRVYLGRMGSGGALSGLWNGPTTISVENSDLIHFDFRKMTASKNEQVMNSQMMLVLRFLENEVSKNRERNIAKKENKHIAIAVDEAHVFIDDKSPAALYFMFQMVKRIRKYNGIFIVITQNVNDFVGAESIKKYTTAIINGCQYSFIFGLNPADLQSLMELYASVGGFSQEERSFIGNAGIGQCLFVVSPGQRITMEKITISKDEEKAFK